MLATLEFGEPFLKTLRGSSAKVMARSATPSGEFWEMYRQLRANQGEALKEHGISVFPMRGKWMVLQFQRNGVFVS